MSATTVVTGSTASSELYPANTSSLSFYAYGTWNGGSVTLQTKVGASWVDVYINGTIVTLSADGVMSAIVCPQSAIFRVSPSGVTTVTCDLKENAKV